MVLWRTPLLIVLASFAPPAGRNKIPNGEHHHRYTHYPRRRRGAVSGRRWLGDRWQTNKDAQTIASGSCPEDRELGRSKCTECRLISIPWAETHACFVPTNGTFASSDEPVPGVCERGRATSWQVRRQGERGNYGPPYLLIKAAKLGCLLYTQSGRRRAITPPTDTASSDRRASGG